MYTYIRRPLARCLEPQVLFLCQIPLPLPPARGSSSHLVANFWCQVPSAGAKLEPKFEQFVSDKCLSKQIHAQAGGNREACTIYIYIYIHDYCCCWKSSGA